ncbi:MAG: hypothetical protein M3464_18300 [Chloroflexota bacterium]|nr:hypothetical protein [Chloroflexota bacterium]
MTGRRGRRGRAETVPLWALIRYTGAAGRVAAVVQGPAKRGSTPGWEREQRCKVLAVDHSLTG